MAGAAPSARPAPFLAPLDVLDRGLLLAESALSLVIVAAMILASVLKTALATAGQNVSWAPSIDIAVMNGTVWAAFLGASYATRGRKHLAIDAIGRLLPERVRRFVAGIANTAGSVVAGALGFGLHEALSIQAQQTSVQALQNAAQGLSNAALDRGFEFQYVIPIGFALIAVRLVLHGFHEFMAAFRGGADPVEPSAPGAASEIAVRPSPPISYASLPEAILAMVALGAIVAISARTTVAPFSALLCIFAALALSVPLLLRFRANKSWAPSAAIEAEPPPPFRATEAAIGLFGVGATLGIAFVFVRSIHTIPVEVGIGVFAALALMGAPLFTILGGLALFLWTHGTSTAPTMALHNAVEDVLGEHFARMSVLPTIPIFTLAGYLMSESKTPQRLVRLARAFLGWMPGGLALVCVIASTFFTVFSGASGITIVAIGGILFPALLANKYPERFSLGLVTSGGALGITFFPCLPLIVYGIVAGLQETPPGVEKVQLDKLIYAGLLPGILVVGLVALFAVFVGIVRKVPTSTFDAREAWAAFWDAKWELFLPVLIAFGFARFGPVPTAALAAFYVFVIEVFVYRDLSLTRDVPRIVPESMVLVGAIFVKLCAATVLTFFFVQAQTADLLFETLTCGPPAEQYLAAHPDLGTCREAVAALVESGQSAGGWIDSATSFLLALNVFLLVVGMLMDIFSAIVVIVPLISGIALFFGVNPYLLGVVFLLNLEIGYLMPPMGLNLFISGFRFNKPVPALYPVVVPFILLFAVALAITTYVPSLTLALVPNAEAAEIHRAGPAPETDSGSAPTDTTPGPSEGDCETPAPGESFDDFMKRCEE